MRKAVNLLLALTLSVAALAATGCGDEAKKQSPEELAKMQENNSKKRLGPAVGANGKSADSAPSNVKGAE